MVEQNNGDSPSAKAAKCYWEEQVNGLGQKELILMLYDGAIKFTSEAKAFIENKDFLHSYEVIVKARNIVTELLCILDMENGGDVAKNLRRLYVYILGRLTEVNFTKETALLDNVVAILQDLRSAWAQIDFDAALSEKVPGNSDNGRNGAGAKLKPPPQLSEQSRILSVTV